MSQKKVITTKKAPQAIGPYSQAIMCGNLLFVSGQIGLEPATGSLVDTTIKNQAHQTLLNIQAILQEANLSMNDVVKTTIFLTTIEDYPVVNEVYGTFFATNKPARSTVVVAHLPKSALCEIECIAAIHKE